MTDKQTEQNDRDEEGKFLPGNSLWRLNAWEPGNEGRPNMFSPEELRDQVIQYVEGRHEQNKTITLSGLRVYLGLSRQGLYDYAEGKYGKTDEDKRAYMYIIDQLNGYMEDEAESKLDREKGSTHGLIFRMKNMWPNYWKDEKHLSVDTKEIRTIQVIVAPDSALYQRLQQQGDVVQFIEHEGKHD